MKYMLKKPLAGFCIGALALAMLASCTPKNGGNAATDDSTMVTSTTHSTGGASAERGKYLVTAVAGCGDCHTPWKMGQQGPEPDMSKMLSGHPAAMHLPPMPAPQPWMAMIAPTFTAFSGPWGVSFAANLTPDSLTGIGAWSQETFMSAIRTGKHMGKGRPILPPMPWPSFKNMTDDDLASIFMYLRSIPAISNQVPEPMTGPQGGMPPPGMGAPPPPGGMPPGGMPPPPPPPKKKK